MKYLYKGFTINSRDEVWLFIVFMAFYLSFLVLDYIFINGLIIYLLDQKHQELKACSQQMAM